MGTQTHDGDNARAARAASPQPRHRGRHTRRRRFGDRRRARRFTKTAVATAVACRNATGVDQRAKCKNFNLGSRKRPQINDHFLGVQHLLRLFVLFYNMSCFLHL